MTKRLILRPAGPQGQYAVIDRLTDRQVAVVVGDGPRGSRWTVYWRGDWAAGSQVRTLSAALAVIESRFEFTQTPRS